MPFLAYKIPLRFCLLMTFETITTKLINHLCTATYFYLCPLFFDIKFKKFPVVGFCIPAFMMFNHRFSWNQLHN